MNIWILEFAYFGYFNYTLSLDTLIIFQDKPLNNTNSIVSTHTTSKLILFLLFILQLFPLIIIIVY